MFVLRKGLYREADTGNSGGDGGNPPPAPPANNGGNPPPGNTGGDPPAFSWDGLKMSPEHSTIVKNHGWKDVGSLVDSYANAQKLIGIKGNEPGRVIVLPKEGAPASEWDPIYKTLGVPDKAEDYALPVPEGQDKAFSGEAAKWMKEAGIPKGAAHKLTTAWNAHVAQMQVKANEALAARDTAQINELKTEWGANYDQNAAVVDRAATEFGMTQEQLAGLKKELGPKGAMKFLHNIGLKIGKEGNFTDGNSNNVNGLNMSPEAARAEITRLRSDQNFVNMWGGDDPKAAAEARQKMDQLHQLAYPGSQPLTIRGQ